jgi:hypothetical protein
MAHATWIAQIEIHPQVSSQGTEVVHVLDAKKMALYWLSASTSANTPEQLIAKMGSGAGVADKQILQSRELTIEHSI